MYRITKVKDLPELKFNVNDRVLMVDDDRVKISMQEIPNKKYRTASYLSASINTLNSAHAELKRFEKTLEDDYFTHPDTLDSVYMPSGMLIHQRDVAQFIAVGSDGGLLTNAEAERMQAECIALINKLKERTMNMFTANLDHIFKLQQSVDAMPLGGFKPDSVKGPNLTGGAERYEEDDGEFNFNNGHFSLSHLMKGSPRLKAKNDFWEKFSINGGAGFNFSEFEDGEFEDILKNIAHRIGALTDLGEDESNIGIYGFCGNSDIGESGEIAVPSLWVDFTLENPKTMPIATIIFEILKRQIYVVIKNLYTEYLVKLTASPSGEGADDTSGGYPPPGDDADPPDDLEPGDEGYIPPEGP